MLYEYLIAVKDYLTTLFYFYCTRKREKLHFEEAELARLDTIINYYRENTNSRKKQL